MHQSREMLDKRTAAPASAPAASLLGAAAVPAAAAAAVVGGATAAGGQAHPRPAQNESVCVSVCVCFVAFVVVQFLPQSSRNACSMRPRRMLHSSGFEPGRPNEVRMASNLRAGVKVKAMCTLLGHPGSQPEQAPARMISSSAPLLHVEQ